MALLVWMYLISLVVLVGAEFNALLFPRAMLGKELTAINSSKWRRCSQYQTYRFRMAAGKT